MLDYIIVPSEFFLFKFDVVSLTVAATSIAYSFVQWWRVIDFTKAIIVWIWMSYACTPLLKFTLVGGLKCLYGFLFIPLTEISPLRGEISVSEPARLIILTQSENEKDFPYHRDLGERDIPLCGTSFFLYKHSLTTKWAGI